MLTKKKVIEKSAAFVKKTFSRRFKAAVLGLRQSLATDSPFKIMKNAFHFTLKALFILKMINFCPDFFVMQENGLIRNVNFKIYDVTNWEKINYDTHIANISRSKHNQKIKYDQLVEYNFK